MVEQFPIVLRGYDKERVDEAFASTQETVDRLREQVKADDQTILELQAQLQEEKNKKANPNSFASLGANAQQMLASAEQTSAELLDRAKKDASAARATVQLQAETLLNNAKLDAKRILDEANAKAEAVLSKANNDAGTLKSNAQREADQLRGEAQKAVVAQRQTVDLELTNSREEHDKRLASERATQERELSDLRAEATEQIAAHAKAGQFVSVYCKEGSRLLPRPISICEIDRKDGALRLVYRVAGKGTEEFSSMHTGMQLKVIGPLGNGFPKQEKKAFLIGGGIGIPPMLELAKELNCEKQIVLGYRDELFLLDEFRKQGEVYIATEDGSVGTRGNVMDAIRENGLNKYTKLLDFLECEVTRNTYREIVALLSSRRIRKFVYDGERYLMLRESLNMPVRIFEKSALEKGLKEHQAKFDIPAEALLSLIARYQI